MGTRDRLNRGFFQGSLLSAGVIGGLTQSWAVFGLALAVLVLLNIPTGEIRFKNRHR